MHATATLPAPDRVTLPDPRPAHGKHRPAVDRRPALTWAAFLLLAAAVTLGAVSLMPSGPVPQPRPRPLPVSATVLDAQERVADVGARPGRDLTTPPPVAASAPVAAAVSTAAPAPAAPARVPAAVHVAPTPAPAAVVAAPAPRTVVADPPPAAAPTNGVELHPHMCTDPVDCPGPYAQPQVSR